MSFTTAALSDGPTSPDLHVTFSAKTPAALVGDDIAFDVKVENSGDADSVQPVVSIPVPGTTEFVSAEWVGESQVTQSVVSLADGVVRITFDSLPAGNSVRINLILRALASGLISVTATATEAGQGTAATGEADVPVTVADRVVQIVNTGPAMCGAGATVGMIGAVFLVPLLTLVTRKPRR